MQISLPLDVNAEVFISEVRSTARILIHRPNSSEAREQIDWTIVLVFTQAISQP